MFTFCVLVLLIGFLRGVSCLHCISLSRFPPSSKFSFWFLDTIRHRGPEYKDSVRPQHDVKVILFQHLNYKHIGLWCSNITKRFIVTSWSKAEQTISTRLVSKDTVTQGRTIHRLFSCTNFFLVFFSIFQKWTCPVSLGFDPQRRIGDGVWDTSKLI